MLEFLALFRDIPHFTTCTTCTVVTSVRILKTFDVYNGRIFVLKTLIM